LRLIRRVVKPLRFGGMALDLSVLVLFLFIFLAGSLVNTLFAYLV